MIEVELFSGRHCSLCDKAKTLIEKVRRELPFNLRETLVEPGSSHYEEYRDHIPVVHINGTFFCRHRVNEEEFRRTLQFPHDKRTTSNESHRQNS